MHPKSVAARTSQSHRTLSLSLSLSLTTYSAHSPVSFWHPKRGRIETYNTRVTPLELNFILDLTFSLRSNSTPSPYHIGSSSCWFWFLKEETQKVEVNMDWTGSLRSFVPRPEPSLNFLYNYNYDPYQGTPSLESSHYVYWVYSQISFCISFIFLCRELERVLQVVLSFLLPH